MLLHKLIYEHVLYSEIFNTRLKIGINISTDVTRQKVSFNNGIKIQAAADI